MAREHLFLLHGLGQTPQMWQDQVVAMPADLPMSAPWLHGLRPGREAPFSLVDSANDLGAVITSQGVQRAYLCGINVGAMVAMQYVLNFDAPSPKGTDSAEQTGGPGVVGGLILVAPQIAPPKLAMRMQRLAIKAMPERRLASQGIQKSAMLQVLDAMAATNFSDRLAHITVPTLVLCGNSDRQAAPASRQLAETLPNARLQIIEGGAHPNLDSPQEFNNAVTGFLEKLRERDESPKA